MKEKADPWDFEVCWSRHPIRGGVCCVLPQGHSHGEHIGISGHEMGDRLFVRWSNDAHALPGRQAEVSEEMDRLLEVKK